MNSRRTNNNVDATPLKEKFEDTKVVIRSRNPKVKQCIDKEKGHKLHSRLKIGQINGGELLL
jgi:hypothetical protein